MKGVFLLQDINTNFMVSFDCLKILWLKWCRQHILENGEKYWYMNIQSEKWQKKEYITSSCVSYNKMVQILITRHNYMNCWPNRRYKIAHFCCNNISHKCLTPDRTPYFNVCSVWASFLFCSVWTVKDFEKVADSVSAAKNGLWKYHKMN